METQELHRGRLIDHIQLVVADLAASRRFYEAVMDVLHPTTDRVADLPVGVARDWVEHEWTTLLALILMLTVAPAAADARSGSVDRAHLTLPPDPFSRRPGARRDGQRFSPG